MAAVDGVVEVAAVVVGGGGVGNLDGDDGDVNWDCGRRDRQIRFC